MKGKLIDKILLVLLLLFTFVLALAFIMLALRSIPMETAQGYISWVYLVDVNAILVGALGVVLFLVAFRLLFFGWGTPKTAQPAPTTALVKVSEFGSTFITLSALDAMVQKHCRANNRIRNIDSVIKPDKDGGVIAISVKLSVMPDTDIPALSAELQASLKDYIESLSGIRVREIGILIEDTSINPAKRAD